MNDFIKLEDFIYNLDVIVFKWLKIEILGSIDLFNVIL